MFIGLKFEETVAKSLSLKSKSMEIFGYCASNKNNQHRIQRKFFENKIPFQGYSPVFSQGRQGFFHPDWSTICQQNCLLLFDHLFGLASKGLTKVKKHFKQIFELWILSRFFFSFSFFFFWVSSGVLRKSWPEKYIQFSFTRLCKCLNQRI